MPSILDFRRFNVYVSNMCHDVLVDTGTSISANILPGHCRIVHSSMAVLAFNAIEKIQVAFLITLRASNDNDKWLAVKSDVKWGSWDI